MEGDMIDFKASPFFLTDEEVRWVRSTLLSMTTEEKIGQIFCITGMETGPKALTDLIQTYHPGGFMYRAGNGEEIQEAYRIMQETSKIPMLLPCNLESGGNGLTTNGTFFGKEMAVAAAGDPEHAYRFGLVCGREGGSVGCNWTFSPIVDLDLNWRNPITNVRTFGSDPDTVITLAKEFIRGLKDAGFPMASCIKHFPGDGADERDQHLLSSVNDLSAEEWERTYGRIYRALIEDGAETVMVGHILQPALTRKLCPGIKDEEIYPGSTNRYLMTELLRNTLGFNGLISTDATPMVGFTGTKTRKDAILSALSGGADVILFCKNMNEDFATIEDGLRSGALSEERLDEAVARQLALKAHLSLPEKVKNGTIIPGKDALKNIGTEEHHTWAYACADEAITLVKDNQKLLPLSPEKTKRVRLTVLGEEESGAFGDNGKIGELLKEKARPAVLICPGGGYFSCSDREAEPVAFAFAAMGYHTFVLRYSVYGQDAFAMRLKDLPVRPESVHPNPVRDIGRAMLKIKERATEWHVDSDRIAICGFSAGAHNCAMYATYWATPMLTDYFQVEAEKLRPAAAILGYCLSDYVYMKEKTAARTPLDREFFAGSNIAFLGGDQSDEKLDEVSPARHVNENNPPTYLWATAADKMVPVQHSPRMAQALADHRISFELLTNRWPKKCVGLRCWVLSGYRVGVKWVQSD